MRKLLPLLTYKKKRCIVLFLLRVKVSLRRIHHAIRHLFNFAVVLKLVPRTGFQLIVFGRIATTENMTIELQYSILYFLFN